jgi:hypothetical protein
MWIFHKFHLDLYFTELLESFKFTASTLSEFVTKNFLSGFVVGLAFCESVSMNVVIFISIILPIYIYPNLLGRKEFYTGFRGGKCDGKLPMEVVQASGIA